LFVVERYKNPSILSWVIYSKQLDLVGFLEIKIKNFSVFFKNNWEKQN